MKFSNESKFAPKTHNELIKQNWHRTDCLAANKLSVEQDVKKLRAWFESQDIEWQRARKARFESRLAGRR